MGCSIAGSANAGVITGEFEYQQDRGLSAPPSRGWFLLTSYLLPQRLGAGQLQPLVKYSASVSMPRPCTGIHAHDARGQPQLHHQRRRCAGRTLLPEAARRAARGRYRLRSSSTQAQFIDPQELGMKPIPLCGAMVRRCD